MYAAEITHERDKSIAVHLGPRQPETTDRSMQDR